MKKTTYVIGGNHYAIDNLKKNYFPKSYRYSKEIGYQVLDVMDAMTGKFDNSTSFDATCFAQEIDSIFSYNEKNYRVERKVDTFYGVTLRFINKKQKRIGSLTIQPIFTLLDNYGNALYFVVTATGYNPLANIPTGNKKVIFQSGGVTIVEKVTSKWNPVNFGFLFETKIYTEKPKNGGSLTSGCTGPYHTKVRKWNKTYEWSKSFRTYEQLASFKEVVEYNFHKYLCD